MQSLAGGRVGCVVGLVAEVAAVVAEFVRIPSSDELGYMCKSPWPVSNNERMHPHETG